jgi:predicted transcriptional regulator
VDKLTVRISRSTHEILQGLAVKLRLPMTAIIDEAVREYQRRKFWEAFDTSCASLKANTKALASYQREAAVWESMSADGLDDMKVNT